MCFEQATWSIWWYRGAICLNKGCGDNSRNSSWLLQIANNIGANGVCILHLFPWVIGVEGIYKGRAYPLN